MTRFACRYAILRFQPYLETGEFANVGIALVCPAANFLDARVLDGRVTTRVKDFFGLGDLGIYRDTLKYFRAEVVRLKGVAAQTGNGRMVSVLFDEMTRAGQGVLHFSDVRVVMTENPEAELENLFIRLVQQRAARMAGRADPMERKLRQTLQEVGLDRLFHERRVGSEELHVQIPFVHRRGETDLLAIKPIDLVKGDPNQIYDVGGRWVDKFRRLARHQLLPERVLLAIKVPQNADAKRRRAAEEIIDDLRFDGVEIVDATKTRAIREFASEAVPNRLPMFH